MVAGLRAANARLRELLVERDELIAELRVQVAGAGELREQVERLRREVADLAAQVKQNSKNSPGAMAAMTAKIAGIIAPAIDAIVGALIAADVAHSGETGFRVAGKLAWVHSASSGKFVVVTVHGKRGRQGMDAAGVLPSFAGIACHDAWAPYDGYDCVAGHALCGAHLLRELTAVTGTGTAGDVIWARQAIDALLELKQAADAARAAGHDAIGAEALEKHGRWFRGAADAGIVLNAARRGKLQRKRHALAARMRDRAGDYLRFAHDLRVPPGNNEAEQVIRMSKLRIKVSGCMRSMHGAEAFCAIRSYLATATRHRVSWPGALTRAAEGTPWIRAPPNPASAATATIRRHTARLPVTVAACPRAQPAPSSACSIILSASSAWKNSPIPCGPWKTSNPAAPWTSSPAPCSPSLA